MRLELMTGESAFCFAFQSFSGKTALCCLESRTQCSEGPGFCVILVLIRRAGTFEETYERAEESDRRERVRERREEN